MSEKIQKVLANAGLGSRRQIETWLREGRIAINGTIAELGQRMEPTDRIRVDGQEVRIEHSFTRKTRVLIYHKPEGEICSRKDPEGRPTVFDRLPMLRNGRWISIGRLDFNTSGILLLTNDGALANKLMHPSAEIEREYAVRVKGEVTPALIRSLKKGVRLEDGMAHFDSVRDAGGEGSNHWYHVIVKEGRNRLVRRLWESQPNIMVSRLIRIRFGNATLPRLLRKGRWEEMPANEIKTAFETNPTDAPQDERNDLQPRRDERKNLKSRDERSDFKSPRSERKSPKSRDERSDFKSPQGERKNPKSRGERSDFKSPQGERKNLKPFQGKRLQSAARPKRNNRSS